MSKQWFIRLTAAIITLLQQTTSLSTTTEARQRLSSPFFQKYGTTWIAGPEMCHYQFHLSEQSWNIAREYCLTSASDLNWLISHYPSSNSIMSERTVQIGLLMTDKEMSIEQEWKWVDNTPLNATYLEWEMLTVNITKKTLDPVHRGRCATISIDNRVLKTVPCDQTPDFDFTNRFICQRSDEQHYEHQKKNNPLYEFFEQLINKSQNDAMAKSEARPAQLQGVRTQVADVQEKKENFLSLINERKENITENNDEDRFSKIREMITKETLTLVDPDVQGKSQADFFADSKKGRTAKNKIANGNKHMLQAKNFLKERKSAVRDDNEKNKSAQTCEIKSDSENNVNISSDSPNVLKQSVRLPSKFCKENDTAQKDPHKWYERFGDIFRNLNLFLKQENSSDLRALLDNNDTNKTLVERLKEALHAKNNTNLSKPHATQKKKMLQNAIDDEQEFSDGVQDHFSNTLGRETDDSSGVLHSQKVEGKATYTESVYETIKLDEIYEREELARHLETSKNRIYEEIRKKLENMLTEHLRNLSDVDISTTSKSDEIRKEITPKIGGKQIYQKEVTVSQHAAQEQKAEPSLLFTDLKKKETEQAISTLPTFINNSRGTSKISIKLSNRTEIEPRVLEVLLLHPNNERPMEINPT